MPSVAKNTMFLTVALVGQKVVSLAYFTLLARYFDVASQGQYTFAIAFTTIFGILVDLGYTPIIIRAISRNREEAMKDLPPVLATKFLLGIIAYGAAIGTAFFLHYSTATILLISGSGIVMVLDGFHLFFYGIMRGLRNLWFEAQGMITGQILTLLAGLIAMKLHAPLVVFMGALGACSIFNVVWSLRALKKFNIPLRAYFDFSVMKRLFVLSVPFALAGIFTKVYGYIDTVMLSSIKGDVAVGFYSVAYKITYAFQFLPMALSAALFPALSSHWEGDKSMFKHVARRALVYAVVIALPLVLTIYILAPELIHTFFSAKYEASIPLLQVSIWGLLLVFIYFPLGSVLNSTFNQTKNTIILGITTVLNIVLNLILIPRFSGMGASIAAVASNLFLCIVAFIVAQRVVKFPVSTAIFFIKAFGAAFLLATVEIFLHHIIWWPLSAALGVLIFFVAMYFMRAFNPDDIQDVRKFIQSVLGRIIKT